MVIPCSIINSANSLSTATSASYTQTVSEASTNRTFLYPLAPCWLPLAC